MQRGVLGAVDRLDRPRGSTGAAGSRRPFSGAGGSGGSAAAGSDAGFSIGVFEDDFPGGARHDAGSGGRAAMGAGSVVVFVVVFVVWK